MKHFLPTRKLSFAEIGVIPEAFRQLFIARLKISFRPSREWMPKANSNPSLELRMENQAEARLLAGVISGLSKRTPWNSTCLVKAFALHRMLNKRAIPHNLHIGVARSVSKGFEAHAWLSVGDEVIVGGGILDEFHEICRI